MADALQLAVGRWLTKAANDLRTAEVMAAQVPPVTDVTCYHAYQCVEKALKALLTQENRHVERTHNLRRLVALCAKTRPEVSHLEAIATELTDYASQSRYPDDWREIPLEEALAAAQKARVALEWVPTRLREGARA
ncbi:MAG: HEPN domain-containing protein [Lentisphaerae bacterium]|jgi:HEPN domain-containing protein|nr:HEPN domain-containing protein [Lentisphaerota bacterium]